MEEGKEVYRLIGHLLLQAGVLVNNMWVWCAGSLSPILGNSWKSRFFQDSVSWGLFERY
jgi:hypothetical protein